MLTLLNCTGVLTCRLRWIGIILVQRHWASYNWNKNKLLLCSSLNWTGENPYISRECEAWNKCYCSHVTNDKDALEMLHMSVRFFILKPHCIILFQEKSSGRQAHYKLTSTAMLWLQVKQIVFPGIVINFIHGILGVQGFAVKKILGSPSGTQPCRSQAW